MVKVLTMGKYLHYYGQNDVARDKVSAKNVVLYWTFLYIFSSHRVFILCIMIDQIYHVSIKHVCPRDVNKL